MKKNAGIRILGRRLARIVPNPELGRAVSGLATTGDQLSPSPVSSPIWTYTLLYPSDPTPPRDDSPQPGGPIYV